MGNQVQESGTAKKERATKSG